MRDDEYGDGTTDPVVGVSHPSPAVWHTFRRGPVSGQFLHDQLEWLATEGLALNRDPGLRSRLVARCERAGYGVEAEALTDWLGRVLATPLAGVGAALQDLDLVRPEMEFWLPWDRLSSAELDRVCQAHLLVGVPRPALRASDLHGMLMGFADAVFEHGGRYWVLDHKSNHLGMGDAAYHPAALAAAMAHHRYDVQAAVYLLALHRLLQTRLGAGYDPTQHLGGAVYLFLRGVHGPAGGVCALPAPPDMLAALDALLPAAGESP
jgi:exodeoxyribonuclease V beta subunit